MGEVGKIILVILLSSVKFIAGPPFAYYNKQYDFTFFETVIYSVAGGMLGVFVFTFFSEQAIKLWHWIKERLKKIIKKKEFFSEPTVDVEEQVKVHYLYVEKNAQPAKKIFTSRNRRVVKVWKKYGLMGIAFITPVLISIPVGTIIANNMVQNRKKIFLYMFISVLFWSLLMTSLFELYHVVTLDELQKEILP
ncbi:MAG TPA: hypothetical protein VJY62_20660 [Bacteroidia bacterium]|nr:hypothetical protein [Bacteroidia bacterium]